MAASSDTLNALRLAPEHHAVGAAAAAGRDTPTPTPTPIATPVAGKSVNATPVSGKVKVKLPGAKSFVDLVAGGKPASRDECGHPRRAGHDPRRRPGRRRPTSIDGLFKISQTKGSKPLTTLTLTEALSCPKAKKSAVGARRRRRRASCRASGKGTFRTEGKYAAATVRGTKWLVTDRCDRTTTKVNGGRGERARQRSSRRSVIVRKGKSYTARKKR